jgi:hypothetical protein
LRRPARPLLAACVTVASARLHVHVVGPCMEHTLLQACDDAYDE